ncbi:MAG: toxin-antitoxin system YwqK family antitoxin [Bacteroidetes bacterium]|nr:toxin-antitoxin system YwqK family antitoxin [Bacteroidota bacterium]
MKELKRNCIFISNWGSGIIVSAVCLLILSSCHHSETENYPSGRLMVEKTMKGKKLDGLLTSWYENGKIKQKADYRNDRLDGKLINWYGNGELQLEEDYRDGVKNGVSKSWDQEGNLIEEKHYKNDTLEGSYKMWFSSGMLKVEGNYHVGMFHGKWNYYSEEGIKVGIGDFVGGTGILNGFDLLGKKIHTVHYSKNKKEGEEIEYNPDGSMKETRVFEQDKIVRTIKGK